ncbi:hypothetical protein CWI75_10265 [Kineobactrum sediminis]|uniref:4-alpha-glucanotransferase n=1 Tax=Kineobactrum sediminis TaxID=1905677 RepID=A0A2N5Y197_9GAMM|nr:hypothetical protein [Kineobactrum sediminis]PLW82167.1 hypothetical protein CWI75_10265 [Kineobactrum sediminis]
MSGDDSRLSTTALARALDIPLQQLFATLRDYGWIERRDEHWLLTPKGEYEGGCYRDSKRYGRYIVWPEALVQHPLLSAIESNQRISASQMRRYYPGLQPRHLNRALAEFGLQQSTILGWELTALGKHFGGQQVQSESSGAFYVSWPHEIVDHPVIQRELERLTARQAVTAAAEPAGPVERTVSGHDSTDLFASAGPIAAPMVECRGIDGHHPGTCLQAAVCDWLYFAQQAHALKRALPVEEELYADFYLPAGRVYIDCWEDGAPAAQLAAWLRNKEVYASLDLRHLEIKAGDAEYLDEVLGRGLLAFGIRC